MSIRDYVKPDSLDAALAVLDGDERAVLLGGGAYLRLGAASHEVVVDLFELGLDGVRAEDDGLTIGGLATYRQLETDPAARRLAGGLLARSVEHIVGVQMRNVVTVGGTLAGRYAFANLTTALLALDATLVWHRAGRQGLDDFMTAKPAGKDILVAVEVADGGVRGAWQDVQRTRTDFAILNVAAVRRGDEWRIAVGSRPGIATLASAAATVAAVSGNPQAAGDAAAEELEFGSDLRGSAEYRRAVCRALVSRAVEEVLS